MTQNMCEARKQTDGGLWGEWLGMVLVDTQESGSPGMPLSVSIVLSCDEGIRIACISSAGKFKQSHYPFKNKL